MNFTDGRIYSRNTIKSGQIILSGSQFNFLVNVIGANNLKF